LIAELAATAAVEVQRVRERFRSFDDILNHIQVSATRKPDFWDHLDAAIAHALVGNTVAGSTWRTEAKENALRLATLLERPADFRLAVVANIARRRRLMRLPPDSHCLDELDSTARP
jgi:hypothetical protein